MIMTEEEMDEQLEQYETYHPECKEVEIKEMEKEKYMYIAFEMVENQGFDFPENIKGFHSLELAQKYKECIGNHVCIEKVKVCEGDFEIYEYLKVVYKPGTDDIKHEFGTITSLNKKKDAVNNIFSLGDTVYVYITINDKKDGYKKMSKIIEILDSIFYNTVLHNFNEEKILNHNVAISDIDKEQFFSCL